MRKRWPESMVVLATGAYFVCLAAVLFGIRELGDRHWLFAMLAYLPTQLWALPLAPLALIAARFAPRLCVLHAACAVVVLGPVMGWRWSAPAACEGAIKVLTNNAAQDNGEGPIAFIASEDPDLAVMQEAGDLAERYATAFPDRSVRSAGPFLVISKLPLASTLTLLPDLVSSQAPAAARFSIDWRGQSVAVYDVHMPTPRPVLDALRAQGIFSTAWNAWLGRDDPARRAFATLLAERRVLIDRLVERVKRETGPAIVAGDFNFPDRAPPYRRAGAYLRDAFATAGRGYGFTFPGFSHNPLTLFGPWLRLDYVWLGRGVEACGARVETSRRAQHRALVTELRVAPAGG